MGTAAKAGPKQGGWNRNLASRVGGRGSGNWTRLLPLRGVSKEPDQKHKDQGSARLSGEEYGQRNLLSHETLQLLTPPYLLCFYPLLHRLPPGCALLSPFQQSIMLPFFFF